ncbi:hypothetical protein P280DRAFT_469872 [Massarina eburnea CBS 473.64]|uniref:MARVEL domain-containing protein n=1 Tax=Massarina eburnea CBS 473.64 TaxID=1395130 RepID=A0A6A6S160_9PLEO|nr:hypothetical protein P280DRAFT_469872 [Massarina eburnea CBS 473.64]
MIATKYTLSQKALISFSNFMVWASSGIVVGITAFFLDKYPHDQHLIFELVIAALTLGFWIPSFILPFLPSYRSFYVAPNFIFSYLWVTSFIFAAQDYNESSCSLNAPTGGSCSLKLTSEAFIFLAFIFSIIATVVDAWAWKTANVVVAAELVHSDKPGPAVA